VAGNECPTHLIVAELAFGSPLARFRVNSSSFRNCRFKCLWASHLLHQPWQRSYAHAQVAASTAPALLQTKFVYFRRSGTRIQPLQPLHVGLYQVLSSRKEGFLVDVGGQQEVVLVDCSKPHLGRALASLAIPQPGADRRSHPLHYFPFSIVALRGAICCRRKIRGTSWEKSSTCTV
jgi:hypothetical protein